ncbi:hypothetical protein B0H13DRAFT_2306820 [Mycena leptocephala]|nr:hypothetical protein B0H13DRAFT_2306820 [Mycena leptocephala]
MPGKEGDTGHPKARSVHMLVPISPPIALPDSSHLVGVILFGERGPAPAHLGHLGVGQFHNDAWALICKPSAVSDTNEHGFVFTELTADVSTEGANQKMTVLGIF